MTEKEAWLEVARRYRKDFPTDGICWELVKLEHAGEITKTQRRAMKQKIVAVMKAEGLVGDARMWPARCQPEDFNCTYDIMRAELCEQFAEECQNE